MGIPVSMAVMGNSLLAKKLNNSPEENNLLLYGGLDNKSTYLWMEKFYPVIKTFNDFNFTKLRF